VRRDGGEFVAGDGELSSEEMGNDLGDIWGLKWER